MMKLSVACVLALAVLAAGAPLPSDSEWSLAATTSASHISFDAVLRLPNADLLKRLVDDVSNPKSAAYGNFLTPAQLETLFGASDVAVATVSEWLRAAGGNVRVIGLKAAVRTTLPIAVAEELLKVSFHEFTHARMHKSIVRTLDTPYIPAELSEHIAYIGGITTFPIVRDIKQHVAIGAPDVTPAILRTLYEVNETASGDNTRTVQGLAEFQDQAYSPKDLAKFISDFDLPAQTIVNKTGNHDDEHGVEANLDVQYIIAMGSKIPTDFYLEAGMDFDLMGWITSVQTSPTLQGVNVWSVSYGEDLSQVTQDYAQRLDQEFQKVAVLGVSIIFASGDSGVYSRTGGTTRFHPSFPACLPTVTAVGATLLNDDKTETTATKWSGGGFSLSDYFTTPSYQQAAVNGYINSGVSLPPQDMWDSKGRAFPDVSAQGVNYIIIERGFKSPVSGTSAAAPCFAGVVSLLNDARANSGKKPLGFLNPFIYQNGAAFNDILLGTNSNGHEYGFTATKGFDPLTGMGTPNYPKLKAAALAA